MTSLVSMQRAPRALSVAEPLALPLSPMGRWAAAILPIRCVHGEQRLLIMRSNSVFLQKTTLYLDWCILYSYLYVYFSLCMCVCVCVRRMWCLCDSLFVEVHNLCVCVMRLKLYMFYKYELLFVCLLCLYSVVMYRETLIIGHLLYSGDFGCRVVGWHD